LNLFGPYKYLDNRKGWVFDFVTKFCPRNKSCFKISTKSAGFTLIESVIGITLMLIIFVGIFGVYQMGFKVVWQSQARITAVSLVNQKLEWARNLSYDNVGTFGGIPSGSIPQTEIISRNDIEYTIRTNVSYIDDSFDGVAPDDFLPNDYKRVRVEIIWTKGFGGEIILMSDVAPKGLETSVGGGNLLITVFNAIGEAVPQADVHLVNSAVSPSIDVYYQTNNDGQYLAAGASASIENYQVTVAKNGYSADRTYGIEEVANSENPRLSVMEGKLTSKSFSIDRTSDFIVNTVSPFGAGGFLDSFVNQSGISEFFNTFIGGGEATLATTTAETLEYESSGYLISNAIAPLNLLSWNEFSWSDNESVDTQINYQVLYATSTEWFLIPNGVLSGNSGGFNISPVNLSGISTSTYSNLKLKGNFSTNSTSTTPILYDWQVSWLTNDSTPIPNIQFGLRGSKIIGTDINETPVYKYAENHISGGDGKKTISGLEWDSYIFSVDKLITGLDISETNPAPQPINLAPNSSQTVFLFLSADNGLLLKIKDNETSDPVFSAGVRLYNAAFGYDVTQFTDVDGETIFIPLKNGSYDYQIQVEGYQSVSGAVFVSGDKIKIIYLIPEGI